MTLLLGKILVSVCVVLGLSWVAENVSTRVAGTISGMPLGAVLVLFFVGRELGPEFATQAAYSAVPSLVATLAFALGYFLAAGVRSRFSPVISAVGGICAYLLVATGLDFVDLGRVTGFCLSLGAVIAAGVALHSIKPNRIAARVRMTWPRLLFRAGTAAAFVVVITSAARLVGPQWSGLLIGFPMIFLPFLLIIHLAYSGDQVRAIIRNFPVGLSSLLVFLVAVGQAIPMLGVNLSILASLAIALVYLAILGTALNRRKPANTIAGPAD